IERTIVITKKYRLYISRQRAQQFNKDFFEEYDYIFVMDRQNYEHVMALAKEERHKAKVKLFLEMDEVPDPSTDDALFEPVYQVIAERCDLLIERGLDYEPKEQL